MPTILVFTDVKLNEFRILPKHVVFNLDKRITGIMMSKKAK